ncbi:MAG: hypothetical protein RPR40_02535, partial [Bermanella sp.]
YNAALNLISNTRVVTMNNNKNKEQTSKLSREIWLFEQWLSSLEGQQGDTQERIRSAYRDCIASRKAELLALQGQMSRLMPA